MLDIACSLFVRWWRPPCAGVLTRGRRPRRHRFSASPRRATTRITLERQAIYDTPGLPGQAADDRHAERRGRRARRSRAIPAQHPGDPVLDPAERLRRRHPAQQLGAERLRHRHARCCSPRATGRRCPGTCGRPQRAGEAARRGDHQRFGAGRRADVLVRGADPGQGRVRRAHLRPAGAGAERHPRRRAPTPWRACRRRPTGGRSTTAPRTRSTSSCRRRPRRTSRCPVCTTGTSHADKQNARVAAHLDAAYNPYWALLDPSELGWPASRTARRGSPTSPNGTRGSRRSSAWDNLGRRCRTGQPARSTGQACGIGEHRAARATRWPITSPGWASRPTTACRRCRTSRTPDPLAKSSGRAPTAPPASTVARS